MFYALATGIAKIFRMVQCFSRTCSLLPVLLAMVQANRRVPR